MIDAEGRIAFKQVGPVTPEIYREKIGPLIERLRRQNPEEPRDIEDDRSNDAVKEDRKLEQK
ncbi:hypothetical protein MESS2_730249 [Mesorhizobium metallidurans STM 2683]|uniref:Uncharacterized protein n=1 Tax=Mesorhizobium metallidurans STM 2683 TaxID=1297569 RepID=M5EWQ8_9HYPH|nr:hypothetical protein MESS2_730249 [Mesorhizobium metallidurans STM 2683]